MVSVSLTLVSVTDQQLLAVAEFSGTKILHVFLVRCYISLLSQQFCNTSDFELHWKLNISVRQLDVGAYPFNNGIPVTRSLTPLDSFYQVITIFMGTIFMGLPFRFLGNG